VSTWEDHTAVWLDDCGVARFVEARRWDAQKSCIHCANDAKKRVSFLDNEFWDSRTPRKNSSISMYDR